MFELLVNSGCAKGTDEAGLGSFLKVVMLQV